MTNATQTLGQIVSSMLKENTGKYTGAICGWQRLADVDLDAQPKLTFDGENVSRSLYHVLVDNLGGLDEVRDGQWLAYVNANGGDWDWDMLHDWINENNFRVMESDNTCNGEHITDGEIQYWDVLDPKSNESFMIVSTHNGADVRGGYATPRIFGAWWEQVVGAMLADATIHCPKCDFEAQTEDNYSWFVWGADGYREQWGVKSHCPKCDDKLVAR